MRLRPARSDAAAAFARSDRPGRGVPWRRAGWCAVDLELTGLDLRKDHIVAIGAVPVEGGRVILGEALYTLVRTSRRPEPGAVLTHKLRAADLVDAPSIDEAIESLFGVLARRVPVFHFAAIERGFLGPVFASRRVRLPSAADTEVLGRLWLQHAGEAAPARLSLGRLARVLGQQPESEHHALADALATAQAFIALAGHLDALEPQSVGTLISASQRLRGSGRFGPS